MDSLVSFDGLSDFANNALDKLSSAVGWVVNYPTTKKQAMDVFIEGVKQGDLPPLEKVALISNAGKIIKEYSNQRNIVAHAIRAMGETAKPQDVSDDFLTLFMDKARLVSDEDFQIIWGKILAEECDTPNSIPKALLHILSHMDKRDAEDFTKLCSVSVLVKDAYHETYCPIILKSYLGYDEYYFQLGITHNMLINLQAESLIQTDVTPFGSSRALVVDTPTTIYYYDESYKLPDGTTELDVGNVLYTKAGQALCRAINGNKQEYFFEKYCIPYWTERLQSLKKTHVTYFLRNYVGAWKIAGLGCTHKNPWQCDEYCQGF